MKTLKTTIVIVSVCLGGCVSYAPTTVDVNYMLSTIPEKELVVKESTPVVQVKEEKSQQTDNCAPLKLPQVGSIPQINLSELRNKSANPTAVEDMLVDHIEKLYKYTVNLKQKWNQSVNAHNTKCH